VTKRETSGVLYSIYVVVLLKDITYFIISFSQMLKKKYIQKYFGIFKNGQKKCPKMKKAEILLEICDL
jgi:hypothetical protein